LRFARAIGTTLLCCLLIGGCAETGGEGPQGYVVQPQDTLYSIAWRHDLDYRDLARWNNIGPSYRITVGQYLVLSPRPGGSPNGSSGNSGTSSGNRNSDSGGGLVVRPANEPVRAGGSTTRVQVPAQKWMWPTDAVGGPVAVPGGGILLRGRLGQDVRAASGGRVVYTGSGLRGYGNLIIIKHGESLLSAYAHNREIVVRDGQDVAVGQVIAHMGEVRAGECVLYFEIRQNGRPVDPLPFLR